MASYTLTHTGQEIDSAVEKVITDKKCVLFSIIII